MDVDLDVAMERGFETSIKFKAKKQTMEMSDYEAMLTKEVAQRGGITRDRPRSFLTIPLCFARRSSKQLNMKNRNEKTIETHDKTINIKSS